MAAVDIASLLNKPYAYTALHRTALFLGVSELVKKILVPISFVFLGRTHTSFFVHLQA